MEMATVVVMQWLHLLAVTAWIGGMIYGGLVLMPSLSALDPPQQGKLMEGIIKRYAILAWTSIVILILTGINKSLANVGTLEELFATPYGFALIAKHILIIIMIILGLVIALVLSPKLKPKPGAESQSGPTRGAIKAQKILKRLSQVNLVLGVLVLFLTSILGTI